MHHSVLITSKARRVINTIAYSYQLHVNAYVTKPVGFDLYTDAVRQIDEFFLALARLPN